MKKRIKALIYIVMISCLTPSQLLIQAQSKISDIDTNPNKQAIEFTVNNGYLPLYQDQTFRTQETINRGELAFIIYKLNTQLNVPSALLPDSSINSESNKLKGLLAQIDAQLSTHTQSLKNLNTEQLILHHDITAINETLRSELALTKKALDQQHLWLWIAVGTVGVLTLSK